MFCPFCGKENPEGSKFCFECGKPLEAGDTSDEPSGSVPPASDSEQGRQAEGAGLDPGRPQPEPQPVPETQAAPASTPAAPPQQPSARAGQTEVKKGGKGPIVAVVVAAVAIIALIAVFVLPGLTGPSDEEVIREGISAEFDAIMDRDSEEYQEIVAEVDETSGMDELGVTGEQFVGSLLDGFDYEITAVEVDNESDSAVCYVTVTSKTFSDILTNLNQRIDELTNDPSMYGKSMDELYALMGDIVMECVDSAEPRPVDLELLCNRDEDGTWSEDESVEDEIYRLLME